MPVASLRPCSVPRCPTLVRGGGRCAHHAKAQQQRGDRLRGTAQERGYDSTWAAFSKQWRQRYPLCGMRSDGALHAQHSRCVQQGQENPHDLVTDHIQPMADGGEKYDEANLQTLCRACNSAKDGWR